MPAERRSFQDALEEVIYWDSSFAIAALIDTHPYHAECLDFRQRLEREGILSVGSDFVHNELAFHVLRDALAAEGQRTGQSWRTVHRQRPDVFLATMPQVDTYRADLNRMTLKLPLTDAVGARAFQLMRDFALLPTDAYHIAVALEAGVTAFTTLEPIRKPPLKWRSDVTKPAYAGWSVVRAGGLCNDSPRFQSGEVFS
jgi:predicted nucleic acid-binding protein